MNVLSLFDGMSCGQQALKKASITIDKYYASEIEKAPQAVTRYNFPDTIFLGDVRKIDVDELDKIDLLIGGSPCQSFSMAGKRNGMTTKENIKVTSLDHYLELKKQGFEFIGQSYLFWEYVRILEEIRQYNPDVKFLLENVLMDKVWEGVISQTLGTHPVEINSALVSAQNRRRLYWTNIGQAEYDLFGNRTCAIPQPEDKGILLKDVIESSVPFINHNGQHKEVEQSLCIDVNYHKGMDNHGQRTMIKDAPDQIGHIGKSNSQANRVYSTEGKSVTLKGEAGGGGAKTGLYLTPREIEKVKKRKGAHSVNDYYKMGAVPFPNDINGKAQTLITNAGGLGREQNYIAVAQRGRYKIDGKRQDHKGSVAGKAVQQYEERTDGKTNTLTTVEKDNYLMNTDNYQIRRLTPIECERLQTVQDNYTAFGIDEKGKKIKISNSARYKMLGNGWTVDVIAYIFSFIDKNQKV